MSQGWSFRSISSILFSHPTVLSGHFFERALSHLPQPCFCSLAPPVLHFPSPQLSLQQPGEQEQGEPLRLAVLFRSSSIRDDLLWLLFGVTAFLSLAADPLYS